MLRPCEGNRHGPGPWNPARHRCVTGAVPTPAPLLKPFRLPAFALLLLCSGCGQGLFDGRPDTGTIEYALSFPDQAANGIMSGMLPEKTTLAFTGDRQVAELSAAMGLFRTSMIMDGQGRTMDYQLTLMGKRITAKLEAADVLEYFSAGGRPTIVHTQRRDTVAGFPCRHAIAIFPRLERPEVELWYTDEIALNAPNWMNPYAEVEGVLLRYEMVHHGLRMRMDASSVRPGQVDPAKFAVGEDFQRVSPAMLKEEMDEVLGSFQQ